MASARASSTRFWSMYVSWRADEVFAPGQPDPRQERIGVAGGLGGRGRLAAEGPAQHDVLARGHAGEDAHELEGPGHPRATHPERWRMEELAAVEPDGPGLGGDLAGDEIEHRGLARAIGPDEADDGAGRHVERQVTNGDQAAERLAQTADPQQDAGAVDRHAAVRPARPAPTRSSQRATPPGR